MTNTKKLKLILRSYKKQIFAFIIYIAIYLAFKIFLIKLIPIEYKAICNFTITIAFLLLIITMGLFIREDYLYETKNGLYWRD